MNKVVSLLLIYGVIPSALAESLEQSILVYRGTSDASAAVAISDDMFIVADDENNVLRVYRTDKDAARTRFLENMPLLSYDLTDFLGVEQDHPEADIEGATMVAEGPRGAGTQRIYWITSHGRNKDGKMRPNRYRFFATAIKVEDENVTIRPVGTPYRTLVHDLIKTERMRHLGLDEATRFDAADLKKEDREKLAPKEQGLNIEALCASADGKTLYIGFRNPRPKTLTAENGNIAENKINHELTRKDTNKKANSKSVRIRENLWQESATSANSAVKRCALVVPLTNPDAVVERGDAPIFGEPILWDLAGLGIRSMEYSPRHKAYFIVAGPHDEEQKFALYRWSGKEGVQPVLVWRLAWQDSRFSPEALIPFKNSSRLLLLSDDGALPIRIRDKSECMEGELNNDGTCPNKFLIDPNKKTFRAIWLTP
jgi:hypothetical protein